MVTVTFDLRHESRSSVRLPFSVVVYSFASCIVSFIRPDCAVERGPIRRQRLAFEFFSDLGLRPLLENVPQGFSLS